MSFWVAGAIVGAGVIGAIGSNMAASTQASGQEQAASTQAGMFNTIVGQEKPFLQGGYGAETELNQLLGTAPATGPKGTASGTGLPGGYLTQPFAPTQAQLNAYPGYQFALQTGGQAVRNADTPGVGALSGPALKDLMSFNVGTANQFYGQYFNQYQQQQNNIFSRLSSIAGLGENAAGNLGNTGAQLGTGIAQAQAGAAASQAGGIVGASNALGGGANTLGALMYLGGGGAGSAGGDAAGGLPSSAYAGAVPEMYCDYYLKNCFEPIRFHNPSHLMLYEFEFREDPGTKHRGFIAQDVQKLYPEAVSEGPRGYLKVNYSKIPGWDELDEMNRENFDS
jgi:hypothetical protein